MDDDLARVIELVANLTDEDRRAVLRHFHDDIRETLNEVGYLPGGGLASGPVVTETAPGRDAAGHTPTRPGAPPVWP